jgi:hypothetical protein
MQGQLDFGRVLEAMIGAASAIIPLWWSNFQQTRKNHAENLEHFSALKHEQNERPNHRHPESEGPLMAENIIYGPKSKTFNGDS